MNVLLGVIALAVGASAGQFFHTFPGESLSFAIQPPPIQQSVFHTFHQDPVPKGVIPHREVVLNAENEARLPPELLNPFYKNPRIAEALAKESWFGPGEEQVINREADKIPRAEVIKLLKQAGLARRR